MMLLCYFLYSGFGGWCGVRATGGLYLGPLGPNSQRHSLDTVMLQVTIFSCTRYIYM